MQTEKQGNWDFVAYENIHPRDSSKGASSMWQTEDTAIA